MLVKFILGWAMQAAAYVFIHRKWKDDKSHFEDMISYFCDIHEPLQLLIFPEGTDLTGKVAGFGSQNFKT
jgi:lysocardiolipin and lysophospholipid acyltransferase